MIAVVGGGITGLALGWELERLGADLVVLEASPRPGGVIRSKLVDGHLLELGPQRTRLTTSFRRLVADLHLEDDLLVAPEGLDLFVYRKGRLRRVPLSLTGLARSDVVSLAAKLRLIAEPLTAGPDPGERVARFFTRKLGAEIYESLVGPLYGGLYASDPADMVVGLSLLPTLNELGVGRSLLLGLMRAGGRVRPPPACSFKSGMTALPEALARRLGGRFRPDAPVRRLRRAGGGWTVELDDGRIEAERVVLTLPAAAAADLLGDVAPEAARIVRGLRYNPLAIVYLEAETPLRGLGFQVAFAERTTTRGVTFNDSLFGRRNVYTAYLGGAQHPEVVSMDPEALATLAAEEFRVFTGFEARAISVERQSMPAWDTTWSALATLALPDGLHVAANWRSRPGIPGRLTEARQLAVFLSASGSGLRLKA